MREIKFRGKDIKTGIWIYGSLIINKHSGIHSIFLDDKKMVTIKNIYTVDEKTIGQYTGLKDKNGKEIYEGDIVRTHFSFGHEVTQEPFVIKWNKERAMFEGSKPKLLENDYLVTFSFFPEQRFLYEVIGNIHDNPELLEVQE